MFSYRESMKNKIIILNIENAKIPIDTKINVINKLITPMNKGNNDTIPTTKKTNIIFPTISLLFTIVSVFRFFSLIKNLINSSILCDY